MMGIKRLFTDQSVYQFLSYVVVGGIATIVEWAFFYFFFHRLSIHYLVSTTIAFVISTAANWVAGRALTFRNTVRQPLFSELAKIYVVSAAGLLFNLVLMYLFVHLLSLQGMASKIIATGVVFMWNYMVRKLWIYRGGSL